MEFRNYRVKSPVKSFRDLEVYQKTIQLSDEITNLPFLNKESFQKDNEDGEFITGHIDLIQLVNPLTSSQSMP